jgi:hypothetical protein
MATVHFPCNLRPRNASLPVFNSSSLQVFKSEESVFPNPRVVIRRAGRSELNHPNG